MINVNIEKRSLEKLLLNGFTLEHSNNVLNVRNIHGKLLIEIIYMESNNKILINSKKESYWCDRIVDICPNYDDNSKRIYLIISYENKCNDYFKSIEDER